METDRKYLDKYNVFDSWGYGVETRHGVFRPLDIINGHIAVQGSDRAPRLYDYERQQAAKRFREMIEGIQFKSPTIGRPKGSRNR